MTTFQIHKSNIETFNRKLKTLQGKARKLGVPAPVYKVVREYEREFIKDFHKWTESYLEIDLADATVSLNGWTFAASVDHRENGNIIRPNPEFSSPESLLAYTHVSSICEHCNTKRYRNNTYIMFDGSNLKQVGSSCIKDFLGHPSAEFYAELYEFMRVYRDKSEEAYSFSRQPDNYLTKSVVEIASMMVRLYGYRSSKVPGESTSNRVRNYLELSPAKYKAIYYHEHEEVTEIDVENAKNSIDTVKNFTPDELKNLFSYNLHTLVNSEWATSKDLGILCYVPEMSAKTIEKQIKQREKEDKDKELQKLSQFTGEVGKRNTWEMNYIKTIYLGSTQFGDIYLHTFMCESNVFVWKTGTNPTLFHDNKGKPFTVTGTIKAHNEYKGIKQNVITRCKYALK